MRFKVIVEPADPLARPSAPRLGLTIDAETREEALDDAETSYRLTYPAVGRLRLRAIRLPPHG